MRFVCLGLNFKTAPINIRERFYFHDVQQDFILSELKNTESIAEALILSTCNRTEIYACVTTEDSLKALLYPLLKELCGADTLDKDLFYSYEGVGALRHLFSVVTSLDSLVLGENQIVGQVKAAMKRSQRRCMMKKNFHTIFDMALRVAKQAHSETNIGYGGTSISWLATQAVKEYVNFDLDVSVAVVGLGEVGRTMLQQLLRSNFTNVTLLNRTYEAACEVQKKWNVQVEPLHALKDVLEKVDVCCVAVSIRDAYLISEELIEDIMRLRQVKKLLCIDLSVPRAVQVPRKSPEGFDFYAVDNLKDLTSVSAEKKRLEAVKEVFSIIDKKIEICMQKIPEIFSKVPLRLAEYKGNFTV